MTEQPTTALTVPRRPMRLPMPRDLQGVTEAKWRTLTDAIYPNARTPESIALALDYCSARGLDIMKKPVNIVPMWNAALGREVETIWPAINETMTTAARTKEWAGMDKPVWGPNQTQTFKGRKKTREGWLDAEVTVTFPEFCEVTVYRLVNGNKCAFTEPVFWLEAYARIGAGQLPNDMWCKRPRGQLHKVAKAASLRSAFPEEGDDPDDPSVHVDAAEIIEVSPPVAQPPEQGIPERPPVEPPHDPETGEVGAPHTIKVVEDETTGDKELPQQWGARFLAGINSAKTVEVIGQWVTLNQAVIDDMKENAPKVHARLEAAINRHRNVLQTPSEPQA